MTVVSLNGQPMSAPGEPDQSVIAQLEDWLEHARSGNVTGIAIAVQYADHATHSSFAGTVSYGMMGRLSSLIHLISSSLNE